MKLFQFFIALRVSLNCDVLCDRDGRQHSELRLFIFFLHLVDQGLHAFQLVLVAHEPDRFLGLIPIADVDFHKNIKLHFVEIQFGFEQVYYGIVGLRAQQDQRLVLIRDFGFLVGHFFERLLDLYGLYFLRDFDLVWV